MNKTLKKVLCAVMALVMLFALTACKKDEDKGGKSGSAGSATIDELFDTYCELFGDGEDTEALLKKMFSPYEWEKNAEELEELFGNIEYRRDEAKKEYGEDYTVTIEVISEEEVDEETLSEMKAHYEELGCEIEDAKKFEVEFITKGELGEYTDPDPVTVVKIDGSWYFYIEY